MNKFVIAASVLAALSAPALAERSYDLRDSDTYTGKYAANQTVNAVTVESAPLAVVSGDYIQGRFGLTKDPLEARRWDEKNN